MTLNAAIMENMAQSLTAAGPAKRDDMLVKIADLFEGVSHLLDDGGVNTFDSIFVSLIATCSEEAKAHLAGAIAANPRAPAKAIRYLAFDDSILVARPVIRLSQVLLDDHLLALATVKSPEHLLAMCERASLNPGITDVILSRANGEIMIALVNNRGAKFSEAGKGKLAEAALDDGGLYDIVMVREDLAAKVLALEDQDSQAAPQLAAPQLARPEEPGLIALEQHLRDMLRGNKTDQALGQLAKQISVPAAAVAKAFALDVHGGFLAYAKAAPLSWDTTLRFLMARYEAGQVTPRLQRAEADYKKLLVSDARRVAALLGQHASKPN